MESRHKPRFPFQLLVVDQDYSVRVDDAVAVRGNTAVLRCIIPDQVRDHVRVTSWLHEEGTAIEIFPEKVRPSLVVFKSGAGVRDIYRRSGGSNLMACS